MNDKIMKTIRVLIERASDGTYSAYMPDENNLPFGLMGDGNTAQEAKDDFLRSHQEMKAYYKEIGKDFPDIQYTFAFDTASFLAYYSKNLSLAGLERITGIAQGQLSHYLTGRRNPSKKTIQKIETSLRQFGDELSHVHLV